MEALYESVNPKCALVGGIESCAFCAELRVNVEVVHQALLQGFTLQELETPGGNSALK